MKLFFLSRYTNKGASSRYRIYQYIPLFKNADVKISPFFDDRYNPGMNFRSLRGIIYVLKCYIRRLIEIVYLINTKNICVLQYEFTPFLPFNVLFFRIFNIKYIVDYDDAVFHNYDQSKNRIIKRLLKNKIPNVIKHAHSVITGSPYLTGFAIKYNKNVFEIPTSIDIDKYKIKAPVNNSKKLIIGWIGSNTTSLHIEKIIEPLKILKLKKIDFEVRLIGFNDDKLDLKNLPIKIIKWDELTEIDQLNQFDVGIMPMIDFPFARGKCAFKLIQYMALAKPTIASPFEANLKVDRNSENLFADTKKEWVEAFLKINDRRNYFVEVGNRNREIIKKEYSIQSNFKKFERIIESAYL